jgi:hypothetical protein
LMKKRCWRQSASDFLELTETTMDNWIRRRCWLPENSCLVSSGRVRWGQAVQEDRWARAVWGVPVAGVVLTVLGAVGVLGAGVVLKVRGAGLVRDSEGDFPGHHRLVRHSLVRVKIGREDVSSQVDAPGLKWLSGCARCLIGWSVTIRVAFL